MAITIYLGSFLSLCVQGDGQGSRPIRGICRLVLANITLQRPIRQKYGQQLKERKTEKPHSNKQNFSTR